MSSLTKKAWNIAEDTLRDDDDEVAVAWRHSGDTEADDDSSAAVVVADGTSEE